MQRFDVLLLKIFGRAVFEACEAEGGCLVKEANFEAEKLFKSRKQLAFQLCFYVLWQFFHQKCLKTNICLLSAVFFPRINSTYISLGCFKVDPNISSRHVWPTTYILFCSTLLHLGTVPSNPSARPTLGLISCHLIGDAPTNSFKDFYNHLQQRSFSFFL